MTKQDRDDIALAGRLCELFAAQAFEAAQAGNLEHAANAYACAEWESETAFRLASA